MTDIDPDFSDLRALFINCTLKRSPEISHTEGLIRISSAIMERHGVAVEVVRAVDHDIATGVWPDMREHGWPSDDWPAIFEQVLAAEVPADDPWLRVILHGSVSAGVAETVREHLGEGVVDVRLDASEADEGPVPTGRISRPPHELFALFLEERQIDDERLGALFAELLDDEMAPEGEDVDAAA